MNEQLYNKPSGGGMKQSKMKHTKVEEISKQ